MSKQEELIRSFSATYWLIGKFAEGLDHEDSIATLPFKANSFNWVLGHILVSRDGALTLLDKESALGADKTKLYETGSELVTVETAVPLERLLEALEKSQTNLTEGLQAVSAETLAAIYDEERDQTIADRLAGLHWHETYHVGQLEILRQINGERNAFP